MFAAAHRKAVVSKLRQRVRQEQRSLHARNGLSSSTISLELTTSDCNRDALLNEYFRMGIDVDSPEPENALHALTAGKDVSALPDLNVAAEIGKLSRCPLRISRVNENYEMSPTYPPLLAIPAIVGDTLLKEAGRFRSRGRIPAVCWTSRLPPKQAPTTFNSPPDSGAADGWVFLARCSQPAVGFFGRRNAADEALVQSLQKFSANPDRFVIADARPKLSAVGNQQRGYGFERVENYCGVRLAFLGIENIHKVSESYRNLIKLVRHSDDTNFFAKLHDSKWLYHLHTIISGASRIAQALFYERCSVLIHCSDGWDRTAQLSSLVQLLLDPYSRTIQGFLRLIDKEWLWFGHMFSSRCGTPELNGTPPVEQVNGLDNTYSDSSGSSNETTPREAKSTSENHQFGRESPSDPRMTPGLPSITPSVRHSIAVIRMADDPTASIPSHTVGLPSMNGKKPPATDAGNSANARPPPKSINYFSEKERSPVFLQFLDCVHQLLLQFPHAFEFNETLLLYLCQQVYGRQFGTFFGNCAREREAFRCNQTFLSVWDNISANPTPFQNRFYIPHHPADAELAHVGCNMHASAVLQPSIHLHSLQLWTALFSSALHSAPVPSSHSVQYFSPNSSLTVNHQTVHTILDEIYAHTDSLERALHIRRSGFSTTDDGKGSHLANDSAHQRAESAMQQLEMVFESLSPDRTTRLRQRRHKSEPPNPVQAQKLSPEHTRNKSDDNSSPPRETASLTLAVNGIPLPFNAPPANRRVSQLTELELGCVQEDT